MLHRLHRQTFAFLLVQKEEEAAAKLYEDFVESFGGGEDKPAANQSTSSFLPGGAIMPGQAAPLRGTHTQPSLILISISAPPATHRMSEHSILQG